MLCDGHVHGSLLTCRPHTEHVTRVLSSTLAVSVMQGLGCPHFPEEAVEAQERLSNLSNVTQSCLPGSKTFLLKHLSATNDQGTGLA